MKRNILSLILIFSLVISNFSIFTNNKFMHLVFNILTKNKTIVFAATKPKKTVITGFTQTQYSITVKWKARKNVRGYQIKYSTSKSFKKSKIIKAYGEYSTSRSIYDIKPNKTYYFKVRCFKINKNYKNIKSKWSSVKTYKTAKKELNRDEDPDYVWINTSCMIWDGKRIEDKPVSTRYHKNSQCEEMIQSGTLSEVETTVDDDGNTHTYYYADPSYECITIEEAEALGYQPCKYCFK